MKNNKKIIVTTLLVLTLAALSGCDTLFSSTDNGLSASGVVEVKEVSVASETGGKAMEVLVNEGDAVEAGDVLLRFEDQLLQAQVAQAETVLAQAQASYNQTAAASQLEMLAAQQTIDELYKHADVARAQAEQNIAELRDAVKDANRRINTLRNGSLSTDVTSAKANLVLLKDQLEDAQEDFEDYANKPETNLTRAAMELKLAEAQRRYDDAVRLLNNLEAEANDIDMAIAQANLAVAEASLVVAESDLEELQDGPDPDLLEMAEARLANAEAAIPLAQSQVDAAQANLDLLQVQLDKLTVTAPIDGSVLNRLAEPGEIILPGSPILTIGMMQNTTITVYIPEDRYGQIDVGDEAEVTVDSFPNEVFTAEVKRIADQAEYTPRNVQTEEERRTTVFAVELSVANTEGKLKPGMPADVSFGVE